MAASKKMIEEMVQTTINVNPDTESSELREVARCEMPTAEFIALTPFPGQRDTALRYQHARQHHLKVASDVQRSVAAVAFKGVTYKADGHTRAFGWETGDLPAPETVHCVFYEANTPEAFQRAYDSFDAASCSKQAADTVQSAYKWNGLALESNLLRKGVGVERQLRTAMAYARGDVKPVKGVSARELVATFGKSLSALDALNMPKPMMVDGFVAAAVLLIQKDGDTAVEFLKLVGAKQGTSAGEDMDGVFAAQTFSRSDEWRKLKADKARKGYDRTALAASVLIGGYLNWQTNATVKRRIGTVKTVVTFNPFAKIEA